MINADGWPYQNVHNTIWALEHHPKLKGAFAFDEMDRTTIIDRDGGVPLTDADVVVVQSYLQKHALMSSIGGHTVGSAIDKVSRDNGFHPIRDYLTGFSWDGKPRLGKMLHSYLGAADTEYHARIGTMFLIAMVARVMRPGCKADYMPILEGPQGKGKSQACSILAGRWFSDALPDLHSKDAAQHLRGKWLIEVSELAAMTRADSSTLKSFITRREERYRPSYGRYEVIEPRQSVFVGTTNDGEYLKDETGGRRFWPVVCGELDLDGLARDRDMLFAEATVLFNAGSPWWPEADFETAIIKPLQTERYQSDAWEEAVKRYVDGREDVTVADCAITALDIDLARLGLPEQHRISKILKSLGLKKTHTKRGNIWRNGA